MTTEINNLISKGNLIKAAKELFNVSISNTKNPSDCILILNAYNRLVQKLASGGDFENAKRVMDLMLILGFTPFLETFIIFLNKYAFDEDVDKIISILKVMSKKNISLPIKHYNKMLKQLVFKKKNRDAALSLIRYMEETIIPPSFLKIIDCGLKMRRYFNRSTYPLCPIGQITFTLPLGYLMKKLEVMIKNIKRYDEPPWYLIKNSKYCYGDKLPPWYLMKNNRNIINNIKRYDQLLLSPGYQNNLEIHSLLWMMTDHEDYRHDFPEFLHCYNVVFKLDEMENYLSYTSL
jgi:pentatricopeptide repeat protein